MVRKKRPASHQQLSARRLAKVSPRPRAAAPKLAEPEPLTNNGLAEEWLTRIRSRLPDEGTAVVTVHRMPRRKFLVSFRASAYGETFISEAREDSLEKGLEVAGSHLFERLQASPPAPHKKGFGERVRELFE